MALTLVIGNKSYSSWSMRPWMLLEAFDIAFSEVVIPLYVDGSKDEILKYAPSGKVPALIDGDVTVKDCSLRDFHDGSHRARDGAQWDAGVDDYVPSPHEIGSRITKAS